MKWKFERVYTEGNIGCYVLNGLGRGKRLEVDFSKKSKNKPKIKPINIDSTFRETKVAS